MKPFYILSLVFSILSTSISAQKNSIYFGAADKNASGIQFSDENFYYELSQDSKSHLISIRKLNKKFEVEEEKTITPKYINTKGLRTNGNAYGPDHVQIDKVHEVALIDNTICIVYSSVQTKEKTIKFSLIRVGTKNLNAVGEEKLLLNLKFSSIKNLPAIPVIIRYSPDKKHLGFFYFSSESTIHKQILSFAIFDSNYEKIWEKNHLFSIRTWDMEIEDLILDNNSNFILMFRELNPRDVMGKTLIKKHKQIFHVYSCINNGEQINDYTFPFTFSYKKNTFCKLSEKNPNQLLIGMSFEAVKDVENSLHNMVVIRNTLYSYDYVKNESNKIMDENAGIDKDSMQYIFEDFFETEDNHIMLVYENKQVNEKFLSDKGIYFSFTDFKFYDLKIEKYSYAGEKVWTNNIYKKFETRSYGFLGSYNLYYYKNKLYIIFNNHLSNSSIADSPDEVVPIKINYLVFRDDNNKVVTPSFNTKNYGYDVENLHPLYAVESNGDISKDELSYNSKQFILKGSNFNANGEMILIHFDLENLGYCRVKIVE